MRTKLETFADERSYLEFRQMLQLRQRIADVF